MHSVFRSVPLLGALSTMFLFNLADAAAVTLQDELRARLGETEKRRIECRTALTAPNAMVNVTFTNKSLRGQDFSNRALADVDLSGADLTGADFSNACLFSVNLTNATLHGAKLDGALIDGRFGFASRSTSTWFTRLLRTSFKGASLRGAVIVTPDIGEVDFTDADLEGALIHCDPSNDWQDCVVRDRYPSSWTYSLAGANLRGALLTDPGRKGDQPPRSIHDLWLAASADAVKQVGAWLRGDGGVVMFQAFSVFENPSLAERFSAHEIREIAALLPGIEVTGIPSFDCSRDLKGADQFVCASPYLGFYDRTVDRMWNAKQRSGDEVDAHRAWMAARQACRDQRCVSTSYMERIFDLASTLSPPVIPTAKLYTDAESAVPRAYAKHVGSAALQRYVALATPESSYLETISGGLSGYTGDARSVCKFLHQETPQQEGLWLLYNDFMLDKGRPVETPDDREYGRAAFLVTPLAIFHFGSNTVGGCGAHAYWRPVHFGIEN